MTLNDLASIGDAYLLPNETNLSQDESNLSWRVGLNYKLNNDALLYGVGVAAALAASSIVGRVDLLLYGALKHRADQSGPAFRYALSSAFAIITLAYGGYAELAAATRQEAKMIPSPPNATVVAVRVLNEDERQRK